MVSCVILYLLIRSFFLDNTYRVQLSVFYFRFVISLDARSLIPENDLTNEKKYDINSKNKVHWAYEDRSKSSVIH